MSCVLCGDFYSIPLFILLNETALAKPLALFDLQVGDPNPHQLTPADLQRDEGVHTEEEVRSSIKFRVASERIEPSLSSCLKNTARRVVGIFECAQVWSLDFPGKMHSSSTLYLKYPSRCEI